MKRLLLKMNLFMLIVYMTFFNFMQTVKAQEKQFENEIILIDPSIKNVETITHALKPNVKVLYFDDHTPMLTSISNALQSNAPVKSLSIVTHGNDGMIFSTSDVIDINSIIQSKSEIEVWKNKFTADGSILLYGCNIAKTDAGKEFCRKISETSEINVSASSNITGSANNGGDWNLEFSTKNTSYSNCFTTLIDKYDGSLYKVLVWSGAGLSSYGASVYNFYNAQAGTTATNLVDNAATMPDLSTYSLVFICNPDRAFNATEINYLKDHLNKGGRIVIIGEHSGFATQNANVTSTFASLGGHLSIQNLMLDGSATYTTSQINTASDLMFGITKLWGSAASAINIGGNATVMLKSVTDPTKIIMAQEILSNGDIIAWADVNEWDKINDSSFDTGKFFINLLTIPGQRVQSLTIANLTTNEANSVSNSSAICGGNITSDNGSTITQRGVCWSTTTAAPTTANSKVIDSNGGIGSFSCNITGLAMNTKYFARAFATNSKGTAYGNAISFTTPSVVNTAPSAVADLFTCQKGGTITGNVMSNDFDADGNTMTATIVTAPSYNSGAFTLNSNGTFTYTNNGTTAPSDFFSYYLSDGISTSATVGVSITLYTPSNPPVGGNGSVTVNANENFNFSSSNFTFSDADAGHVFAGIKVVTLPAKGILKYAGLPVSAGAICSDVTKLTFNTNGDSGTSSFTSFTFKVEASSGEESASSYTMSINKVGKTAATISLTGLSQTYSGSPIPATFTTSPAGLSADITYNGSATIPTNAGTYAVVATINDVTYEGSASGSLVISAKSVSITGLAGVNKVYDGTTTATLSGTAALSGVITADAANVTLSGTRNSVFSQTNIGTGIGITVSGYTLSGTASGNYALTQPTGLKANITAKELTVTGATAQSKVYNGNNTATISGATLSGVVGSDNVVLATATSGTFAQTTVGTNITVTPAMTITGTAIGNYTLTQPTGLKANITAKELTVTGATAQSKVYNGNNTATISGATLSGVVGSDNVVLATATSGTFAQTTVGTNITVTPAMTITGTAIGNYTLTQPSGLKANITAKELTVTGATAQSKVYNGNNAATISGATLSGVVGSDNVVLATATSGTFAQTTVGTNITVTPAMTITGTAIGNYTLTQPTGLKANITAKELTVTGATAQSKVYNGNNTATISGASLSGVVGSDNVVLATATSGTFAQTTVGTNITVTPAMTITGTAIGNYTLTQPTGLKANITAKELTVTGAVAKDKIYNGNNVAIIEGATINGIVGSEDVVLATATSGTFAQTTVGTNITVTPAMTITGTAIGNYTLTQPTGLKANITAKELTVTGATAQSKVYNGNNTATISGASLSGVVGSDNVVLATATSGTFAQTTVGTNITVTPAMTITGTAIGNYTLTQPTGLKANITAKELTVTGAVAKDKIYNGNNVAIIEGATINGIVGSEDVVLATATSGTFAQTTVGTNITVTPAMTITGTAIGNYTLTQPTGLKANITAKELTVTGAVAKDKIYNGNNVAMIEGATINGIVGSEDVVLATATEGTFAQSGIGADIAVTPAMTITGAAIGNYTLIQPTGLKANISAKELTVTGATAKDKIYNGNNVAMIEGATINGIVGSEDVVLATATEGTFAQSGIGADITVTPAMTITGAAIGNYTLTQPTGLKANITAKELTVTGAVAKDKIYNGNNVAMIEGATINGIVGSEDVVLATATEGTFAQSGIGTDIAVTPAMTITGAAIDNYTLTQPTGLKANITAKELTVTGAVAKDKIYNGNNVAMIEGATINGIVGSEDVVLATATEGTFAQSGIGTDIAVTPAMTITGAAIGNYTLTQPTGLKANITAKELTVTGAVAKDKIYNGNNVAMIEGATINGIVGSEDVVLATATEGTFAQSGIGTDIAVTPAMTITGAAIGNYTLTQPTGLKANITAKELTVTGAVAKDKIYNGNNVAMIEGATINGIVGSEDVVLATATEGTFAQSGIGTDIAVTPAMTITGAAIDNYTLTQPTGLKANITAKELTVTGAVAKDKIYNGNNVAMIEGATINGIVGSEDVVLATATEGTFAQSGIGTDIAVTPAMTITGAAIDNYTLTQPTGLKANITAKELTVTGAVAKDKIYNGNNVAMIEGATINGIVGSEDVVLATATEGTFAQSGIGADIAVTPAMTITGAAIGNYTLIQPTGLKANISAKELTVTGATAKDKIYNGNNVAMIEGATINGIVGSEDVVLATATEGTFAQSGIGTDIAVTPAMTITGAAIGNYTLTQPTGLKANITAKELTVTGAVAKDKIYNGNNLAMIEGATINGIVGSEDVVLATATEGTFAQSGIGADIVVTPAMTITGAAIGNYTLTQPTGLKANITAKELIVSEPTIEKAKVYDRNYTAEVIAGFLLNVEPCDTGKVSINAIATYSDNNVGGNKTITVKYEISGSAAGNYTAPADYTYSADEVKIEPKQLTITDPVVVANKLVDGNSQAEITKLGELSGVVAADADNLIINAIATYDNANVGTGKTITVTYSLSGSAKDNYVAPASFVITGTKISDNIALTPLLIPATAGCEGSDIELAYTIQTGTPTQYKISYDSEAIAAGMKNVDYTNLPSGNQNGTLTLAIPVGTAYGTFHGTLRMQNELGTESAEYTFQFTVNVSSTDIHTKFDDVVFVDNSGKNFATYQWYKNGVEIPGATKQFYADPLGLSGSYSVKIQTVAGETIFSCPKELTLSKVHKVRTYPNPVKVAHNCTVEVEGYSDRELENAKLSLYNAQGILVYSTGTVNRINPVSLNGIAGIYVGHLTMENGSTHTFKLVVEE